MAVMLSTFGDIFVFKYILNKNGFNPHPPKRVVTTPSKFFAVTPNQKESDLNHLGNLKYILCGHFDEKKMGNCRGVRYTVKDVGWGWLPHEKIKIRHFEKFIYCMV